MPTTSLEVKVIVSFFLVLYIAFLIQSAARNRMDLYDFCFLSCVAIAPFTIVVFPAVGHCLTKAIGVAYPFVLLFSFLFLVVFAYLHHLLMALNKQKQINTQLIQRVGLITMDVQELLSENKDKNKTQGSFKVNEI
jgi:hypothetical protein